MVDQVVKSGNRYQFVNQIGGVLMGTVERISDTAGSLTMSDVSTLFFFIFFSASFLIYLNNLYFFFF